MQMRAKWSLRGGGLEVAPGDIFELDSKEECTRLVRLGAAEIIPESKPAKPKGDKGAKGKDEQDPGAGINPALVPDGEKQ